MLRPIIIATTILLGSCVSSNQPETPPQNHPLVDPIDPPPTMDTFIWNWDAIDKEHPAKRYLNALKRYHERLELYIVQLERALEDKRPEGPCSRFIPFPVPAIKPLPESVDLSTYSNEEEAFNAFGEYTRELYNYAYNLREIYLDDVKRFNQQCEVK